MRLCGSGVATLKKPSAVGVEQKRQVHAIEAVPEPDDIAWLSLIEAALNKVSSRNWER